MQEHSLRMPVLWTALFVAPLLLTGPASAQLDKQEQKCANSINKGAAKVAKAQAGDNAACIKNGSKGKLTTSIEACLTGDVKGKVAKAISKIKTGDCSGGSPPSFLPGLKTNSGAIGDTMKNKDLNLIHDIFGTDLDLSISADKAAGKCQAAIAKAVGKCQSAKLGSFNSCKKDKLKAGDTDIQACLGTGTGGIPDGKGKISKACGGDFGIGKKCGGQDLNALLPGLAPNAGAGAIDAVIECRVCGALNSLDGLFRDCDLFDDGLANGSCPSFSQSCQHNIEAFCVGGSNNGDPCPFSGNDVADCGAPGAPTVRCVPTSHARLDSATGLPSVIGGILFELIGGDTYSAGPIDPNDGTGTFTCGLTDPIGLEIPTIGTACLQEVGGCADGLIDCDGGTALDLDMVHHHDIGPIALGLEPGFLTADCRGTDPACFIAGDPSCTAHATCADMCDLYCPTLGAGYEVFTSGCEGFCRGGDHDNELCLNDVNCEGAGVENSGECLGGNPVAHQGECTCDCIKVGSGDPSPAGSFWCQVGIRTVLESASPCDQLDIIQIIGQQCVPRTTETITNTVLFADDDESLTINQSDSGSRISCGDLFGGNLSGLAAAGNQTSYDGDLGDSATRTIQVCQ